MWGITSKSTNGQNFFSGEWQSVLVMYVKPVTITELQQLFQIIILPEFLLHINQWDLSYDESSLVEIMAWCLYSTKPLSQPMMTQVPDTHICITTPTQFHTPHQKYFRFQPPGSITAFAIFSIIPLRVTHQHFTTNTTISSTSNLGRLL